MATKTHDANKHLKLYLYVFAALAVLTVVTVGVAYMASWMKFSIAAAVVLALVVASIKGTLVASFFMHLTHERPALFWILAVCLLFFIALLLLPVLQTTETAGLVDKLSMVVREATTRCL